MTGQLPARVLVTGASGLLGVALTSALAARGSQVIACARRPFTSPGAELTLSCDLSAADAVDALLARHPVDLVFHLAAQSQIGAAAAMPGDSFASNTAATWNLCEALRRHAPGAALLVASSCAVEAAAAAMASAAPAPALSPYAASKLCAEIVARSYFANDGLAGGIVRFSNLYGPADRNLARLIPGTIDALLQGRRPQLHSNGTRLLDLLHVTDAARGLLAVAAHCRDQELRGAVLTLCAGRRIAVRDVALRLGALLSRPDLSPLYGSRSDPPDPPPPSSSAILASLGWRAMIDLDEGLRDTLNWYSCKHSPAATDSIGNPHEPTR